MSQATMELCVSSFVFLLWRKRAFCTWGWILWHSGTMVKRLIYWYIPLVNRIFIIKTSSWTKLMCFFCQGSLCGLMKLASDLWALFKPENTVVIWTSTSFLQLFSDGPICVKQAIQSTEWRNMEPKPYVGIFSVVWSMFSL